MSNTKPFSTFCSPFQQEPVVAMPLIHLTEIELVSTTSLCLLVDLSDFSDAGLQHLESLLSGGEQQQYASIVVDAERKRRQATRSVLRLVLGLLTGVSAAEVSIGVGPHGKPYLMGPRAIGFSVSHSGELSLLAFALDAEIGCDIEKKSPLEDIRGLSEVALHPEEAETILKLNGRAASDAFLRNWVRKEAALKAMGVGFSVDPTQINVADTL